MGKGRITKEEQIYRIRMLLRFIFIFRYATREELFKFGQDRLKLSYPRWLIDYSVKQGFIATYREPALSLKVYYLTQRGKGLSLKLSHLLAITASIIRTPALIPLSIKKLLLRAIFISISNWR